MSGSWVDTKVRDFSAADANFTSQYLRAKLSGDHTVTQAGAFDDTLGVNRAIVGSGDRVGIILANGQGTLPMVASGAITQNAKVYGAASGKISATPSGRFLGWALEATTADGDVAEIALCAGRNGTGDAPEPVVAKTADYTVVAADMGKTFTTTGAAGAVVFTLPAPAAALVGARVKFRATANQNMKVASAAVDQIVTFNDLDADAASFETANEKTGGGFDALCISATLWLVEIIAEETQTVTVTT